MMRPWRRDDHPLRVQAGEMSEGGDVDLDHVHLRTGIGSDEPSQGPETRVVHQHVHLKLRLLKVVEDPVRAVGVGQVDRDDQGLDAKVLSQVGSNLLQLIGRPGDESYVVPLPGQDLGQLVADSARRSRDEGAGSRLSHGSRALPTVLASVPNHASRRSAS